MNSYQMLASLDFKEYYDAMVADTYNSTPETRAKLNDCYAKNEAYLKTEQEKIRQQFINELGYDMYQFVAELMKSKYFLVGKTNPFRLEWNLGSDDNDDYWSIKFQKGRFDYVLDICGGYGGTQILEKDISKNRVLELINKK